MSNGSTSNGSTSNGSASAGTTASVSTHILDTSTGRPAPGVTVLLSARTGPDGRWTALGSAATDADGRCTDLPAPPQDTTHVRLGFETEAYFSHRRAEARQDAPRAGDSGAFFPEVTVTFAVSPGEHHHVPLLLSPFGYSVYRGS
ncbi:hydroxyisourate hydrolase [Streptomyces sp. NPDC051567]|uniref:hydroxyisourate hydrolase n=1 Tax=Streptomyces sp. NPDC051567 TaxID=3365660 RepID=UPI00379A3F14